LVLLAYCPGERVHAGKGAGTPHITLELSSWRVTLAAGSIRHSQLSLKMATAPVLGCGLRRRCGLTWQPATKHQAAALSHLPFPLSGMGRRNGQKGKLMV